MAVKFYPDTVEGSELDYSRIFGQGSKTRGGLVTGVDGDPTTAMEQCITAIGLQLGASMNVGGQTMVFNRIVAKALGGDSMRVQLIFEAVPFGTPTAYQVTCKTSLQGYDRDTYPGSGLPIRCPAWTDTTPGKTIVNPTTGHTEHAPSATIPADNVTMPFLRPIREVTISGVKYGVPKEGQYEENIGYANASQWRGKGPGFWVISAGGTDASRFSGYYSFNIGCMTQNNEPWSQIGILRNRQTGRYIDGSAADIKALQALPYAYGEIGTKPGIVRVGKFDTIDFDAAFGFRSSQLVGQGINVGGSGGTPNPLI